MKRLRKERLHNQRLEQINVSVALKKVGFFFLQFAVTDK